MANLTPLGFFFTGTNGYVWAKENVGSFNYYGATYANLANGKFFGFGAPATGTSASYRYSTDGTTWTTGTLPSALRWGVAATNGSRIVVIATNDDVAAYSDNGTTWTSISMPGAIGFEQIIWDGTRFLAVSVDTGAGNLSYSSDGITFTGIDISSLTGFVSIGYDGSSRYIVGRDSATTTARTTTSNPQTAGNWSNLTMPSSQIWNSFVFGNAIWVAGAENTTSYATSTNGTTWTSRTLPATFGAGGNHYSKMLFFDGYFWFLGETSNQAILYRSSDGITWDTVQNFGLVVDGANDRLNNITGWAATEGTIVGFGAYNNTVADGDDGIKGVK